MVRATQKKKIKKRKNKLQASTAGPLSFGLFIFHTQHVQGSICSLIRGISSTSFFLSTSSAEGRNSGESLLQLLQTQHDSQYTEPQVV